MQQCADEERLWKNLINRRWHSPKFGPHDTLSKLWYQQLWEQEKLVSSEIVNELHERRMMIDTIEPDDHHEIIPPQGSIWTRLQSKFSGLFK